MEYMTAKEASILWGVTKRRVQALLEHGRITGAKKLGSQWIIPENAQKPLDGRKKASELIPNAVE